ncbi:MAG: hypothetical protein R2789_12265 [Microthrixaceae bacterium]
MHSNPKSTADHGVVTGQPSATSPMAQRVERPHPITSTTATNTNADTAAVRVKRS